MDDQPDDPRLRATLPTPGDGAGDVSGGDTGARLVVVDGPRRGEIVPLESSSLRIGRQVDNDLVVESERVSRRHARLDRTPAESWTVTDLGSVNGTAVNGAQLARGDARRLASRDVVQLPGITLIFLQGSDQDAQPTGGPGSLRLETIDLDEDRIRAEAEEAIRDFLDSRSGGRG